MPGMTFYGVSVLAFGFPGSQMSCIGLQELCFQAKMSPPTWRETEEIGCESMGYRKTTIKIRLWWLQKKCSYPTVCVVIFLFRISSFDYGLNNPWFIGAPWDIYYSPCGKECYLLVTPSLTEQFTLVVNFQETTVRACLQSGTAADLSKSEWHSAVIVSCGGTEEILLLWTYPGQSGTSLSDWLWAQRLSWYPQPSWGLLYFMLCRKN